MNITNPEPFYCTPEDIDEGANGNEDESPEKEYVPKHLRPDYDGVDKYWDLTAEQLDDLMNPF